MVNAKIHCSWRMGSLVRNWPTPVATSVSQSVTLRLEAILTESKVRQSESHRVVLERHQEESSIRQDPPDENITHDPSWKRICMHRAGTNPVQRDKVPGQRTCYGAHVDGTRRGAVAEVGEGEVEEVDDDEQLGEPEVGADPEVDEAEEEEVGGDVVGSDVGGGGNVDGVARVEGVGVDELEEHDENPSGGSVAVCGCSADGERAGVPVDAGHDAVLGEGGRSVVAPDGASGLVALMRPLESVVDGGNQEDDVGDEGGDAVENQLSRRELFPASERVHC